MLSIWLGHGTVNSDNHSDRTTTIFGRSVDRMIWYPGGARLITDQQVVLLRQKLMEGKTQQAAAAASATS